MDPAAEKYYSWSGYNYVMDSPLLLVDPDGKGVAGDYYDKNGNHLGSDGKKDGKIYMVNGGKFNVKDFQSGGKYEDNHAALNEDLGPGYSVDEVDMDSEIGLLARIGFAEFRGSNDAEQQAGMDITLNRVESDKFPNTLEGVIADEGQYSSLEEGDPNKPFFDNPVSQLKSSTVNERAWVKSVSNAIKVLRGGKRGISNGAVLYYSPRSMSPRYSKPDWNFSNLQQVDIKGARTSHIKAYKYKGGGG